MKNKLTDNLGLKIGSVFFAAILWLLVTNINDPSSPQKFYNVPVKILNAEMITGQNKVYEVLEDTDVIDVVTVMAPRSVIDTISQDNIIAVADMNDLTNLNTISIKLSTNKYNEKLDDITGNIDSIKLNIEDKETIGLALKATTSGNVDEGFIVSDVTTEQNLVRISGPESVISRINKAEVNVAVTGFTSDIGTETEIKLYDEEGTEIPKNNLTLNINSVRVNVEILATKQIPIKLTASGTPAAGYRATGVVSITPETVLIAGKGNILKNLSVLEIPETALDITGLTENLVTVIDLKEYLPGNIEFGDSEFNGKVSAEVFIEPEIVRNFVIKEEDISIVNMPEAYNGSISTFEEEFTIQVRGLAADVNSINAGDIMGTVDVAKLLEDGVMEAVGEGYYDVALAFNLPENVDLKEKITVRLNIKEK